MKNQGAENRKSTYLDSHERNMELEEIYWDSYEDETGSFDLPQTFEATHARVSRKARLIEHAEICFERLRLDDFRMGSGRLNRRATAKALAEEIKQRNLRLGLEDESNPGLRTMENLVQHLLDHPE